MKTQTRTLTCAALFAALTAIFSQIAIPLPGLVPFNLATLSVFLCGALLGAKWGAISQLVYLCLGLIGIPVFFGLRSGLGTLAGPTGGYLVGYVLAALVVGLLLQLFPHKWMLPVSMLAGLTLCYTLGTLWYAVSTGTPLLAALGSSVLPFLPGDALKIIVASVVATRIGVLRYLPAATGKTHCGASKK